MMSTDTSFVENNELEQNGNLGADKLSREEQRETFLTQFCLPIARRKHLMAITVNSNHLKLIGL